MAEQAPPTDMPADEAALMKEIDAILGMGAGAPADGAAPADMPMDAPADPTVVEEAPADEMAAMEMPAESAESAGPVDVSPIVEALGVTEERAMQLYEAAQTIPAMEGIEPADLAMELSADFTKLMQLEKIIGSKADMEADDAMMVEDDMPAEESPQSEEM
jgi:hypothetical protein